MNKKQSAILEAREYAEMFGNIFSQIELIIDLASILEDGGLGYVDILETTQEIMGEI